MLETHTAVRGYREQSQEYRAYAERQSDYTTRILMLRLAEHSNTAAEELERRSERAMA